MSIKKEIFVTRKSFDTCIDITYGTDIFPIELRIADYVLPGSSIAVAYAIKQDKSGELKKSVCEISDNTIILNPKPGFFDLGKNTLQIRITASGKELYTYKGEVMCYGNIVSDDAKEVEDNPTLMEQILSTVGEIKEEVGTKQPLGSYVTTDDFDQEKSILNKSINDKVALEKEERIAANNAEEAERKREIAVERARIDAIAALPQGATSSDFALEDIKVKFNGETADTPGNAVREQTLYLDKKIDDETSRLSEEIDDFTNGIENLEIIDDSYVEEDGSIESYSGWKRTDYIKCNGVKRIFITSNVRDSIYNCFYDENKNFISSFVTICYNNDVKSYGYRNTIVVPDNAHYFILSNTNDGMDETKVEFVFGNIIRNINSEYDCYIASSNSKYAEFADYVCYGSNDQRIINEAILEKRTKSIYFYPDSEFVLSAPILAKDDLVLKSHGAKFTTPNMVTHFVASNNDGFDNTLVVDSKDGFSIGMYLYMEDDDGNNDYNIITEIHTTTPPKLVLKNNHKNVWLTNKNPVVKSASPCIMIDNNKNVTVDGLHIDWNVENNPIQTYNPWFLQEGVSIFESEYVTIKNCKINNGGRRGITTYDAKYVTINGCHIDNWKEHAIDIFCSYSKNGNTLEYPILQNSIITNTTCTNCSMSGIQNHRGSGIVIKGCVCEGNNYGIRTQEYAHDVNIMGNVLVGNNINGVYVSQDCFNVSVCDNIISNNDWEGVIVYQASNVSVLNNDITKNYRSGVKIEESSKCLIASNMVNNNNIICENNPVSGEYGSAITLFKSTKNKVTGNIIDQNNGFTDYGVWEDEMSDRNIVSDNTIIGAMKKDSIQIVGSNSINRNNDILD